jgi:hypothetical protein
LGLLIYSTEFFGIVPLLFHYPPGQTLRFEKNFRSPGTMPALMPLTLSKPFFYPDAGMLFRQRHRRSAVNQNNERPPIMKKLQLPAIFAVLLCAGSVFAQTSFQAVLNAAGENPPNSSTATGFGTVVLNAAQDQITVDFSWSGLSAAATAAHIHGPAGAGTNASVLFPFSGVPSATAGSIPEQSFAITPIQVGYLFGGLLYMNIHDANFTGGEIRGQLTLAPEPSTFALLGLGAVTAIGFGRKKLLARFVRAV